MNEENKVIQIKLDDIIPNRFQPREMFDETGLEELAESIREHGVIQPVIVRRLGDKYELIAGERRTKASALAGNTTIPAIVRKMDDRESAKVSLLENLQRKNLSAIEEAKTYKRILELENMTQEELARTMGRSQPMVANKLRLLSLPEEVQEALMKNQISERHARSLLTIQDKKDQLMFLDRIRKERLTVRELDSEIKKYKNDNIEKEEKDKERYMNNNRSNFGGMGLNDYQSGVNNMFNNIPNNFNNMSTGNDMVNQQDSNFNNQPMQFNDNEGVNNQMINSNPSSLGSMFDGVTTPPVNNMMNNSDNNNLFVSQIREDNVPPKANQFLPNFDDQDNNFNEPTNQFNSFETNNYNDNQMPTNYNEPMNNMYQQPNVNETYMNNQFVPNNDMQQMNNNQAMNYVPNQVGNEQYNNSFNDNMYMNNQEFNQPMNNQVPNPQPNQNNNFEFYGNQVATPMNSYQSIEERPNNQPINNEFSMNSINQYNGMNNQNNNIPDFGNPNNYSMNMNMNANPNNGGLFNQPLNIVGPYGGPAPEDTRPTPPVNNMPINNNIPTNNPFEFNRNIENNYSENKVEQQNIPIENNMPEPSVSTPEPVEQNMFEKEMPEFEQQSNDYSQTSLEEQDNNEPVEPMETKQEEMPNIPDIEVIGDNEVPFTVENKEKLEEPKNDYIRLDEEITMHSVKDAVMELKKTTDRIKQNHINIETEEIDFDDVYQITIKIKKEDI